MSIRKLLEVRVREKFDWHQSRDRRWHVSLGVRNCRVRITQRVLGGPFFAVTWIEGRRLQTSLRTSKRAEAQRLAEAWLLQIHERDHAPAQPLTLRRLWDQYQTSSAGYQQNTGRTKADKRAAARRLLTFFGETKPVTELTSNDVERYLVARRTGSGRLAGSVSGPVRTRTAVDDLCLLRAMVLWATKERISDGQWLLQENPLRGVKLPKEESPRRPVISYDRYEKMRDAAERLATAAKKEVSRNRWLRMKMALALAEATGARIGSIRGLRWSDVDYEHETIRWSANFHKRRRDFIVDLPPELAAELKGLQARLAAVGDAWLFPTRDASGPWPREVFRQLWVRAEETAQLPHLPGGGWHTLRRKWAIERKDLSPVDVAGAGGWKDLAVLQTIYQIPTQEGIRHVMRYPGKLREKQWVATDRGGMYPA